ncbi:MAG: hypothetical protein FJ405_14955 [Verrucomicrobia bacterium]|nr:hypothetical protein [Verrucomicrobiota bacterium]
MNSLPRSPGVLRSFLCLLLVLTISRGSATLGAAELPHPGMPPIPGIGQVSFFRELLQMDPGRQAKALANRIPGNRELLEKKLREYEMLSQTERDTRLRALEFHHYMKALMAVPEEVQRTWLTAIPAEYRRLCEDRLRLWNLLPQELKAFVQDNEMKRQWLTRWQGASAAERERLLSSMSERQRKEMELNAALWRAMSPSERDKVWRGARQMLELGSDGQRKVLMALTANHREQAERFVDLMSRASVAQRDARLDGLRKFTEMDTVDRARYLRAWEQWQKMTEQERSSWRQLQARISR